MKLLPLFPPYIGARFTHADPAGVYELMTGELDGVCVIQFPQADAEILIGGVAMENPRPGQIMLNATTGPVQLAVRFAAPLLQTYDITLAILQPGTRTSGELQNLSILPGVYWRVGARALLVAVGVASTIEFCAHTSGRLRIAAAWTAGTTGPEFRVKSMSNGGLFSLSGWMQCPDGAEFGIADLAVTLPAVYSLHVTRGAWYTLDLRHTTAAPVACTLDIGIQE